MLVWEKLFRYKGGDSDRGGFRVYKICFGRQQASLPLFFLRELSAMEPSDSTSTTTSMEEPDSLEVLVKTLDSQTRTFIVGAQVRPQHFWKTRINSSSYRSLILREEHDFLVLESSFIGSFVHILGQFLVFLVE